MVGWKEERWAALKVVAKVERKVVGTVAKKVGGKAGS